MTITSTTMRPLLVLQLAFSLAYCSPSFFSELTGIEDSSDEDLSVMEHLLSYGETLFSTPDSKAGEAVSAWSPDKETNPEELGTYLEGDILFPRKLTKNGLKAKSARWPHGRVPYVIQGLFSTQDLNIINQSINEYHKKTCVRFVPRSNEADYIIFTSSNTGCWSSVGRIGGGQEVNLQSPGCLTKKGTVMHEMMHALGFLHEQNRWERDDHVSIQFQNIQSGRANNFEKAPKETTDALGIPYDYSSVMHYSSTAFSINGRPTIIAKNKGATLGQRETFSHQDIQKIRRMYKCNKKKKNYY